MKSQLAKFSTELEGYLKTHQLKEFSWWEEILRTYNFEALKNRIVEDLERDNIELKAMKFKLVQFYTHFPKPASSSRFSN